MEAKTQPQAATDTNTNIYPARTAKNWTRTTIIMAILTVAPVAISPLVLSGLTTGTEADLLLIPVAFFLFAALAVLEVAVLAFDLILARRYLMQVRPRGLKRLLPLLVIILAVAAPVWLVFSLK